MVKGANAVAGGWCWFRLVLAWSASLVLQSAHAAEPLGVADFFRRPLLSEPVVSPSGRYVAALMTVGPDARQRLAMLNLQDLSKSKMLAEFGDADIRFVRWVNDDRLVFSLANAQAPASREWGEGLFSIDREGKEPMRRLIKRQLLFVAEAGRPGDRELSALHRFHSTLRDGSSDVVVVKYNLDGRRDVVDTSLLRLDTATGRTRSITEGAPNNTLYWALDGDGVPRATVSVREGKSRLYWKAKADAAWQMMQEYDTFGASDERLRPFGVGKDDVLYAAAIVGKDVDTESLVQQDLNAKAVAPKPLLSLKGYDFSGSLVFGAKGELRGVHYLNDARNTFWFDPELKKIQEKVDSQLPGTLNRLDCGHCDKLDTVLVTSSSDRQPPVYYLYDVKAGQLALMSRSRPWVDPKTMATRDMVRITARDGLEMPVHVTRPPGHKGAAPMVVLVHGGPFVRGGEWRWDEESQFLASRGYVVVEPEFRGSAGFGARHLRAGFKQWGLAMQDDIADAALWAVKQGFADPARVCIAGASYGGYAALMGLIRHPQTYRCAINWVGVTDLDLLYSINWSDFDDMSKTYGLPALIGDRQKDAAQLAATSPLKQAARLTQPLLMAYGGLDKRVPMEHGVQLRDALRGNNPNLEWKVYDDEGHGWMLQANQVDFWTRVEKFLDRYLKNPR